MSNVYIPLNIIRAALLDALEWSETEPTDADFHSPVELVYEHEGRNYWVTVEQGEDEA